MYHRHVGTEHLLLAVLQIEESPATEALWSLGVDISRARAAVEEALTPESRCGKPGGTRLTPRARDILQRAAVAQANGLTAPSASILSDLCAERTGIATKLLQMLGVAPVALRETLARSADRDG